MDKKTANQIITELYPGAIGKPTTIESLLDNSRGVDTNGKVHYRPYFVAASLMLTEYRRVKKADVVEFFDYDKNAIEAIANMQTPLDVGLTIGDGYSIDDLLGSMLTSDNLYSEFFTTKSSC